MLDQLSSLPLCYTVSFSALSVSVVNIALLICTGFRLAPRIS